MRRAPLGEHVEPAEGIADELERRDQVQVVARVERAQHAEHQPQVVVERQPAHEDVARRAPVEPDDQAELLLQRPAHHRDALGQRGRAGRELHQRQIGRRGRRELRRGGDRVGRHQLGRRQTAQARERRPHRVGDAVALAEELEVRPRPAAAFVARLHREGDRAGADQGQERGDHLDRGLELQQHAGVAADAGRAEGLHAGPDPPVQLAVRIEHRLFAEGSIEIQTAAGIGVGQAANHVDHSTHPVARGGGVPPGDRELPAARIPI